MGDRAHRSGSLLYLQRSAWGPELRSALIAVEQMQVPLSHTQWPHEAEGQLQTTP